MSLAFTSVIPELVDATSDATILVVESVLVEFVVFEFSVVVGWEVVFVESLLCSLRSLTLLSFDSVVDIDTLSEAIYPVGFYRNKVSSQTHTHIHIHTQERERGSLERQGEKEMN